MTKQDVKHKFFFFGLCFATKHKVVVVRVVRVLSLSGNALLNLVSFIRPFAWQPKKRRRKEKKIQLNINY